MGLPETIFSGFSAVNVVAKFREYAGHPGQRGQVRIRVLLEAIEVAQI